MPKAAALNMGMALVYLLVKPSLYHPNSWNNLLVLASPVWFSVLREFEYGIKKATDFSVEKRGKPGPTCVPRANLPEKTTGFFLGRSHMEIVLRPVIKNTGVTVYDEPASKRSRCLDCSVPLIDYQDQKGKLPSSNNVWSKILSATKTKPCPRTSHTQHHALLQLGKIIDPTLNVVDIFGFIWWSMTGRMPNKMVRLILLHFSSGYRFNTTVV